ncbi:MAG: c-type cytochrome [Rubricoccaceae bacterium]|nr:c-type cytochrome [Rubricoccaceae bacterium]
MSITKVLRQHLLQYAIGAVLWIAAIGCGPDTEPESERAGLVPATALIATVDSLPRDPAIASLPADSAHAAQILYGLRVMRETPTLADEFVGNALTCQNCHLNAGQREKALPLVGVASLFPQFRSRDGRLVTLEDRIRGCFLRSMNGTAPPYDNPELLALSAYIAWLGKGHEAGISPSWQGENRISPEARIPIAELDVDRGEELYSLHCAACHGADGQGLDMGLAKPGPLWGENSWNDGAGAARIYTLAGFIRYAMPLTDPGTLTDEEAQQISAYVNSHARPVFPNKEADYPGVQRPQDAVYDPAVFERNPFFPVQD